MSTLKGTRNLVRYFETIIQSPISQIKNIDEITSYLKRTCDSDLEVIFALSIISNFENTPNDTPYRYAGGDSFFEPELKDGFIILGEAYFYSHSYVGSGAGNSLLRPQVEHNGYVWDFGIFSTEWVSPENRNQLKLEYLIDVDGFNVHRFQRSKDLKKLNSVSSGIVGVRVLEELFKSMNSAASAVLFETIFCCGWSNHNESKVLAEITCEHCLERHKLVVKNRNKGCEPLQAGEVGC